MALCPGAGTDPMCEEELKFVYELHPDFAVRIVRIVLCDLDLLSAGPAHVRCGAAVERA